MDPDKQNEIYHKGFKAGATHSEASKETLDLFKKMREDFNNLDKIILVIKEKLLNINDIEKKFAAKWTERVVQGLVAIILIAVISQIVNNVIKTNNQEELKVVIGEMIEANNNKFFDK